ncbi:MAG: hypothetical protein NC082_09195 [Clostridiales bacterium]|nr:hypothetical protein [Clostridiales bacterium]
MRHIKVFVSSSLRHPQARSIIKECLDGIYTPHSNATDDEKIEFTTYVHETNGKNEIVNHVSSQHLINAELEDHNVFILYAGDVVGNMTVLEFEKALASPEFNIKFIYVLHNENDILTPRSDDTHYMPWKEFYDTKMKNLDRDFYETFTGIDTLREKVLNIRKRLAERQIVPLSPLDMNYSLMISDSQKDYRKFTTYMHRGELDNSMFEALEFNHDDTPLPLLIVTGQSLAGKTRTVINSLGKLNPAEVKIHYLRGFNPRTEEVFRNINPHSQFHAGWHHILFIDEIDNLIFNELKFASLAPKFFDLCEFASSHPDRLRIVGTSATDFSTLVSLLTIPSTPVTWLRYVRNIDIPSMSLKELQSMVRRLRVLNIFDPEDMRKVKDGMPLGALFVDLTKLKNQFSKFYPSQSGSQVTREILYARCVFDAVKSIVLWKDTSSIDPTLLLHFLNNAYGLKSRDGKDFFTEQDVENFIAEQKEFINIYSTSLTDYEYRVDDIIADEILMFCDDHQQPADYPTAIKRIIDYIITCNPEEKFEDLSKLIHRTYARTGDIKLADLIVEDVMRRFSISEITDARELTTTIDGGAKNWAEVMLNRIAYHMIRHQSFTHALDLFNTTGSHGVLSELVEYASTEEEKDTVNKILFNSNGSVKEEYAQSTDKKLLHNIFNLLDFNNAFDLFCSLDMDRIVCANHRTVRNEQVYIDESLRETVSLYFSMLLQKVERYADFDTAFSILDALNMSRSNEDKTPFFNSDFERYFLMPKKHSWRLLSENITSHDLRKVFTTLYKIPVPEGTTIIDDISLTRTEIFNYLLDKMDFDQALPTWEDMKNVRDSFSLVQILSKAPDFSIAKGLMDSFISGGIGKHVKIGITAVNALLATTRDISDATECVRYYRDIGYLPSANDQTGPDQFEDLLRINDMYTQGILIARDFIGFQSRCRILGLHVDPTVVRTEGTLCYVLYKAPGFEVAEEILFGKPAFITPDEQKLLCHSPVALSWLAGRTFSPSQKNRLDQRLQEVMAATRADGTLHDVFDPATANIINEYIGNENLTPTYEDAIAAVEYFTTQLGFNPANDLTETKLLWRYLQSDKSREDKISKANAHVLKQSHLKRSHVWQNVLARFLLSSRKQSPKSISLTQTEVYPFIKSTGEWTLREENVIDYMRNMMEHRYLHPQALYFTLKVLLDNIKSGSDRDRSISLFKDLVNRALNNRTYMTHRHVMLLSNNMSRVSDLKIDLRPLALDYSIIRDLCDRLESDRISPRSAMTELNGYCQSYPIKIYIPARFYNHLALSIARHDKFTVSEHIDIFKNCDGGGLSSYTVSPLMHAVRTYDEYLSVKKLWGKKLLPEFYKAFPSVLQNMAKAGSQKDVNLIIRDCLGWDGNIFATPVPIANTLAIRIASLWSEKNAAELIGIFTLSGFCDNNSTISTESEDIISDILDETPEESYDSISQQLLRANRTADEIITILEYASLHNERLKDKVLLYRLSSIKPSLDQAKEIVDILQKEELIGINQKNYHLVLLAGKNWQFDFGMIRSLINDCSMALDSHDFFSALHLIETLDDYLFLKKHYEYPLNGRHCEIIIKRINDRSGVIPIFRHDIFNHFNTPVNLEIISQLTKEDSKLRSVIERNIKLNNRRREPYMIEFCNFCNAILLAQ